MKTNSSLRIALPAPPGAGRPRSRGRRPGRQWICWMALLGVAAAAPADESADKSAIEALLNDSYLRGIYTVQNADLVRQGFHPDFNLTVVDGDEILYVPLEGWIDYEGLNLTEDRKSPEHKAKRSASLAIRSIDIVENVANVKAEVRVEGELAYTNFYGLAKTNDKWQVVTKHFARHGSH